MEEKKITLRQSTLDKNIASSVLIKNGKKGKDDKELKEGKDTKKKVAFEEDEKKKEIEVWKKWFKDELKKIRNESLDLDKVKAEILQKEVEMVIKVENLEKRLTEIENSLRKLEEDMAQREEEQFDAESTEGDSQQDESVWGSSSGNGTESKASSKASGKSRRSVRSRVSGRSVSVSSAWSLSDADVWKMKKLMRENERRDRETNIVIKGDLRSGQDLKECVSQLMNDRLGIKVNIEAVWKTGSVIVARLSSMDDKREVMRNKKKLAGSRVFIENDLSYEDRKRQEEIVRWVKDRKAEGLNLRIGFGKIADGEKWIKWEDKQALKELENKGKEKGGKGENEENMKKKDREEKRERRKGREGEVIGNMKETVKDLE